MIKKTRKSMTEKKSYSAPKSGKTVKENEGVQRTGVIISVVGRVEDEDGRVFYVNSQGLWNEYPIIQLLPLQWTCIIPLGKPYCNLFGPDWVVTVSKTSQPRHSVGAYYQSQPATAKHPTVLQTRNQDGLQWARFVPFVSLANVEKYSLI